MRTSALHRWSVLGLIALMTACYSPEPPTGAPCNPTGGVCPEGQQCIAQVCRDPADVPIGCSSTDACMTAMTLGTVSGDTPGAVLTASGGQAAWYRVRVTENDDTVTGKTVRVAARLTPPASAEFAVLLYVNVDTDVVECVTQVGTTTVSGKVTQTRAVWGEGAIPNGLNDGRDVAIEVRPLAGTCGAGERWELTIEGNWN